MSKPTFRRSLELAPKPGGMGFSGWASRYNETDSYGTRMRPGAFTRSLQRQGYQTPLRAEHDETIGVVRYEERPEGIWADATVSDTTRGRDYQTLIRDGAVRGISVGFNVTAPAVERASGGRWIVRATGAPLVDIDEADVMESSAVTFPSLTSAEIMHVRKLQSRGQTFRVVLPEAKREAQTPQVGDYVTYDDNGNMALGQVEEIYTMASNDIPDGGPVPSGDNPVLKVAGLAQNADGDWVPTGDVDFKLTSDVEGANDAEGEDSAMPPIEDTPDVVDSGVGDTDASVTVGSRTDPATLSPGNDLQAAAQASDDDGNGNGTDVAEPEPVKPPDAMSGADPDALRSIGNEAMILAAALNAFAVKALSAAGPAAPDPMQRRAPGPTVRPRVPQAVRAPVRPVSRPDPVLNPGAYIAAFLSRSN